MRRGWRATKPTWSLPPHHTHAERVEKGEGGPTMGQESKRSTSNRSTAPQLTRTLTNKPKKGETVDGEERVEELWERVRGQVVGDPYLETWCDENCMKRYLRARKGNLQKAQEMLENSLAWRKKMRPELLRWKDVEYQNTLGKMYRSPYPAKDGSPIIIMRPSLENQFGDHEGNIKYLVYVLENAANYAKYGKRSERFIILVDFWKYSLKHAPPLKTSLETLHILQDQFPERLGQAIAYDPPRIFGIFWKMISPFIDPVTYGKIKFIHKKSKSSMEFMEERFNLDLVEEKIGGRLHYSYDHEEYGKVMEKEEILYSQGKGPEESTPRTTPVGSPKPSPPKENGETIEKGEEFHMEDEFYDALTISPGLISVI